MTFEERIFLRNAVSDIQREKESRARRMWILGRNRKKIYMGGGSRPDKEQIRSGYPSSDDSGWSARNRRKGAI